MNNKQLSRIVLKGYKSIKECDLQLKELNILIGPNGAGKSNFISFFRLIQQLLDKNLQRYVSTQGGPNALLHFGRKVTPSMAVELYFGNNGYKFALEPTKDSRMMFSDECHWWNQSGDKSVGGGHFETNHEAHQSGISQYTIPAMKVWRVYHFHDTSDSASIKQLADLSDYRALRSDASNLASFLFYLKERFPQNYDRIVKTIRLVAPFFGDFLLEPKFLNEEKIELQWTEVGQDIPFNAHTLSDGTLRFICIATVLLQPEQLQPETIIIDEPELGLHPYAIRLLGSLIRTASNEKQIIVSTQSTDLLNEFLPEDIIVADRIEGSTQLARLNSEELEEWLEEYSLGELWQKNLFGGRPSR
ncbi:MAG: AAA family ATPase [Balneolales bacterium]|nr:AAA family ATPase [Balneolales bacterium]